MMKTIAPLVAACTLAACDRTSVPAERSSVADTPAARALDSTIAKAVSDAGIVGAATAVIVDSTVVWSRAYGFADREARVPLTPQTVMNVASIAKTTIGVTLMRLVADGKLNLDEDINRYLPFTVVNPHQPTARITLRHLATHTSSIVDREAFYESLYLPVGHAQPSLDSLLRSYLVPGGVNYRAENFLTVAPGKSRDYSNLAATLAAYIVERTVNEPFRAHTRRVIFTPLGMRSAGWFRAEVDSALHSRLYVQDSTATKPVAPYELASYPDGGLQLSLADLSTYFATLMNGGRRGNVRILDSASMAAMTQFQWTPTNHPDDFELSEGNTGLFWRTKLNGARVGHGGHDPGVSAEMLTDAKGRVGVIIMSNTSLLDKNTKFEWAIIDALTAYGEAMAR